MTDQDSDMDGVRAEKVAGLKRSRAGYKSSLTVKSKELIRSLQQEEEDIVKEKIEAVEEALSKFEECHLEICDLIKVGNNDEEYADDDEDAEYYKVIKEKTEACLGEAGRWLFKKRKPSSHSSDSKSRHSSKSRTSSVMRREAAAKRAALEVKAKATKLAHEKILQLEKQKTAAALEAEQIRKAAELETEQIQIEVDLATAKAVEDALIEIENEEAEARSKRFPITLPQQAEGTQDEIILTTSYQQSAMQPPMINYHRQEPNEDLRTDTVHIEKIEQASRLNPYADTWKGRVNDRHQRQEPCYQRFAQQYGRLDDNTTCQNKSKLEERPEEKYKKPELGYQRFAGQHGEPEDIATCQHKNYQDYEEPAWGNYHHNAMNPSILLKLQTQLLEVLQLPKVELPKFSGDPLDYYEFMKNFDEVIGGTSVSASVKLNRLIQSCCGKAASAIKCCNIMKAEDGYKKAREMLKTRFGNSFLISEAWLEKVRKTKELKPHDKLGLQAYADDIRSCLEVFRQLDREYEMDSDSRILEIIKKLPTYSQNRFKIEAVKMKEERGTRVKMQQVVEFVDKVAREANDPLYGDLGSGSQNTKAEGTKNKKEVNKLRGSSFNVEVEKKGNSSTGTKMQTGKIKSETDTTQGTKSVGSSCQLCEGAHWLYECTEFKKKRPEQRLSFARSKKLCFNCLRSSNHRVSQCTKWNGCSVRGCRQWHSNLLHDAFEEEDNNYYANYNRTAQSYVCNPPRTETKVVLPIVKVGVQARGSSESVPVLALLDPGSNSTFCSRTLVKKLGIKGKPTTLSLATLNRGPDTEVQEVSLSVTAGGRNKNQMSFSRVFAVENFPTMKNSVADKEDIKKYSHLSDIQLPNAEKISVELIIGQDQPHCLRPLEVRHGKDYEPYAVRTLLGWIINGPIGARSKEGQAISNFIHAMPSSEVSLEEQVKQFWAVDGDQHLAKFKSEMSVNDHQVINLWEQSTKLEDRHYQLPIPFKSNPPEMHNNRSMAEKRLQSLKFRLKKDPKLLKQYKDEIETQVAKGYAEEVPPNEMEGVQGLVWYLPAFNVKHPSKPEKFRIVFDCAARSKDVSLNQCVMKGPDLTNKLLGVLLRFRQEGVAVMADIEAMFHQVRVVPEHRDVLRFLWWKDGDLMKEPCTYRMNVHLFGGIWSPSCASYALQRTAKDQVSNFSPQAISTVMKNFYADDCLKSVEDEDKAIKLVKELCEMLASRGFHLTKWMSNSKKVLSSVLPEERAKGVKSLNLSQDALPIEHALGLEWDTEEDHLSIRTMARKKENTKRGLLSVLSSVYDPLGLVSPFVLLAKKIFQDECRQGKGWDEELTPISQEKWKKWQSDLPKLSEFRVDRCFVPSDFGKIISVQLHHFCDASQEAYGAVSYIRMTNEDGRIHCTLVAAKSKLAPIKQMTIPRLELSAAVVAVKLDVTIRNELEWELKESTFWTDSMIVLQYIRNKHRRFLTFVANRISVIQECSLAEQWMHVGTELNPADDASRGLTGEEMVNNARWKQGPDFLWKTEEHWPSCQTAIEDLLVNDKEVKQVKDHVAFYATYDDDKSATDKLLQHYSCLFRLKKAVAWLCRFGSWLKEKRSATGTWSMKGENLKAEELMRAEKAIIKYVQKNQYVKEINAIRTNQQGCPRSSSIYGLEPFIHDDEVLRVSGRLQGAPISEEAKHPAIMPQEHHIAELIVRDAHEKVGHFGREYVMAHIRQRYWIPKVRHLINRVIRACTMCKRNRGSRGVQRMANLPEERVTPGKPAFTSVGIDCFGPFLVKRGRSQEKRYGCIFTCLAVRAIHIEKLSSMDADSFINALVRFTARRGKPEKIRSDNGSNFVGGHRELQKAVAQWNESTKLRTHLLQANIEWSFNPPTASHMGGVWERQIRTVRKTLTALAGNLVLDDERLDTLFCHVESIVNGRPLTPVSNDPKDLEALTPNHLLLLRPGHETIHAPTCPKDQYGKKWKQAQFLADQFWRRWTREYLPTLQLRSKWLEQKKNVEVGDLVLLMEEGTPRQLWPLGRIDQVFKGKDGLVRSVEVRTANNKLVRPVTKLCPLEGYEETPKSQEVRE